MADLFQLSRGSMIKLPVLKIGQSHHDKQFCYDETIEYKCTSAELGLRRDYFLHFATDLNKK